MSETTNNPTTVIRGLIACCRLMLDALEGMVGKPDPCPPQPQPPLPGMSDGDAPANAPPPPTSTPAEVRVAPISGPAKKRMKGGLE